MPYATWPPGISGNPFPQGTSIGTKQTFESSAKAFRTSWGPGKSRPGSTRDREFHSTPIELSGAQVATFNTWFSDTLRNGIDKFTWVNMITGASNAVYRFRLDEQGGVKRPNWDLISPAPNFVTAPGSGGTTQRRYTSVIELELMPE
jgi:hypothetical protein